MMGLVNLGFIIMFGYLINFEDKFFFACGKRFANMISFRKNLLIQTEKSVLKK